MGLGLTSPLSTRKPGVADITAGILLYYNWYINILQLVYYYITTAISLNYNCYISILQLVCYYITTCLLLYYSLYITILQLVYYYIKTASYQITAITILQLVYYHITTDILLYYIFVYHVIFATTEEGPGFKGIIARNQWCFGEPTPPAQQQPQSNNLAPLGSAPNHCPKGNIVRT